MPRTPIIMVTANALEDHKLRSRAAGADLHLAKPITAQDLRSALHEVLMRTEEAASARASLKNSPSLVA